MPVSGFGSNECFVSNFNSRYFVQLRKKYDLSIMKSAEKIQKDVL